MSKVAYVWATVGAVLVVVWIPAAGGALGLAVIVASIVWWLLNPVRDIWSYEPVRPRGYPLAALTYRQEIVGESHYQAGIARVVAAYGRSPWAVLTHEPGNPHDPSAIRVDLVTDAGLSTCGYLPRAVAPNWVPMVRKLAKRGEKPRMRADVRGGLSGAPSFGVWLVPDGVNNRRRRPRFENVDESVQEYWSKQPRNGHPDVRGLG